MNTISETRTSQRSDGVRTGGSIALALLVVAGLAVPSWYVLRDRRPPATELEVRELPLAGCSARHVAADADELWAGCYPDDVVRIDPTTGRELERIEVEGVIDAISLAGGVLWVAAQVAPDDGDATTTATTRYLLHRIGEDRSLRSVELDVQYAEPDVVAFDGGALIGPLDGEIALVDDDLTVDELDLELAASRLAGRSTDDGWVLAVGDRDGEIELASWSDGRFDHERLGRLDARVVDLDVDVPDGGDPHLVAATGERTIVADPFGPAPVEIDAGSDATVVLDGDAVWWTGSRQLHVSGTDGTRAATWSAYQAARIDDAIVIPSDDRPGVWLAVYGSVVRMTTGVER